MREHVAPLLGVEPAAPASGACPDVLMMLSQHIEDEISAERCAEMERHLEGCARCRGTAATGVAMIPTFAPPRARCRVRVTVRPTLSRSRRPSQSPTPPSPRSRPKPPGLRELQGGQEIGLRRAHRPRCWAVCDRRGLYGQRPESVLRLDRTRRSEAREPTDSSATRSKKNSKSSSPSVTRPETALLVHGRIR